MPELRDVEGFRRVIDTHARGRRITRVEAPDASVLRNTTAAALGRALRGRRFRPPERHGKWLLARTDGPTVLLHFGMTGELVWAEDDEGRHAHDRVIVVTEGGELRYRDQRKLQGIWLAADGECIEEITGRQGPPMPSACPAATSKGSWPTGEVDSRPRSWTSRWSPAWGIC